MREPKRSRNAPSEKPVYLRRGQLAGDLVKDLDELAIVDRVSTHALELDRGVTQGGSRAAKLVARAQLRSHAAEELGNPNWLGDEVVGARRKPARAIGRCGNDYPNVTPLSLTAQAVEQRTIALHEVSPTTRRAIDVRSRLISMR